MREIKHGNSKYAHSTTLQQLLFLFALGKHFSQNEESDGGGRLCFGILTDEWVARFRVFLRKSPKLSCIGVVEKIVKQFNVKNDMTVTKDFLPLESKAHLAKTVR